MNHAPTDRSQPQTAPLGPECLPDEALQRFADERDNLEMAERARFEDHVDGCSACAARLHDVRRFRTLLLRSRVTGLNHEQWRALDERMALMGSEPPPRAISVGARAYWGVTIAAGLAALAVGGWTLVSERVEADQAAQVANEIVAARSLAAQTPLSLRGQLAGLMAHNGDGHWVALQDGAPVAAGMMIRGGATDAVMELGAEAQTHVATLTVRAGAEVAMETATGRDVFVRVRSGEVELAVDHRRDDQRFAVLAGGFRVQVVGTRFSVRHGADASVSVDVREGAVRVDAADIATAPIAETLTVVRAGQRWQARGGRISFGPIEGGSAGVEPILPTASRHDATVAPANEDPGILGAPANGDPSALGPPAAVLGEATRSPTHSASRARVTTHLPGPPPLPDLSAPAETSAARPPQAPAAAAPGAKPATQAATAPDTVTPRRFLIEVPPQRMSAEEVERARASESSPVRSRPRPAQLGK